MRACEAPGGMHQAAAVIAARLGGCGGGGALPDTIVPRSRHAPWHSGFRPSIASVSRRPVSPSHPQRELAMKSS